jgi:transketolase
MNKISNKEAMGEILVEVGKIDHDIIVLTSDARNSSSITNFVKELPEQFVEVGIAEQNMVSIAAGLAASGKKPFITSPACFLSSRTIEQIKIDVAYSKTNVKIIGISGGVSYGALGMSHHSLQDISVMRAIPGITVMLPADRYETQNMVETLVDYKGPVYARIGRNPVPDVYESKIYGFKIGKAVTLKDGSDITIITTGETAKLAVDSAAILQKEGIICRVINMHTIKPIDKDAIIKAAKETGHIITIEESSIHGGLGSAVAEVVVQNHLAYMEIIGIPDEPAITGDPMQIFDYYGLSTSNIIKKVKKMLKDKKVHSYG